MDDARGLFGINRAGNAVDGRPVCRVVWTMALLRRIGPAVEAGDSAFLATLEQAIRLALETALTPQMGEGGLHASAAFRRVMACRCTGARAISGPR
jgi:hypothetical protein